MPHRSSLAILLASLVLGCSRVSVEVTSCPSDDDECGPPAEAPSAGDASGRAAPDAGQPAAVGRVRPGGGPARTVVRGHAKLSRTRGGLGEPLEDNSVFGIAVEHLGDLDGDGSQELAVGKWHESTGGCRRGGVLIVSLCSDGSALGVRRINTLEGGLTQAASAAGLSGLMDHDHFSNALARLGDLDGDGITELAVGAHQDDDGGGLFSAIGAVWILFLNADGTVRAASKIGATTGGLRGPLRALDQFGFSLAPLGDLDGDGVPDLAVGVFGDDEDGTPAPPLDNDLGSVYVLFLRADGTVKREEKIGAVRGGIAPGSLSPRDSFGTGLECVGDLNGDGFADLAVGAAGDGGGAVYLLLLDPRSQAMGNPTGTIVVGQTKLSGASPGFSGQLDPGDFFGVALQVLPDLDGNGMLELAVGACFDDDGAQDSGALWILHLRPDLSIEAHDKISSRRGFFSGLLDAGDEFGVALTSLGDLDGDGVPELACGARRDDDGGNGAPDPCGAARAFPDSDVGAVWILNLWTP